MRVVFTMLVLSSVFRLSAQEAGDVVVVKAANRAELKDEGQVITTVPTCAHLVVERVGDEGYWVRNLEDYKAGWILKEQVIPVNEAVEFFTQQIREDLTSSSYRYRGIAYWERGDNEKAVEDFTESIRLNPDLADTWNFRAEAWSRLGENDKAIADCNEAIKRAPKWVAPYNTRGIARERKGEYGKALADYNRVIELDPGYARGYNNRAWIWATCPDRNFQDVDRAIESATRACELTDWRVHYPLGTLAAAYAEKGEIEKAVEYQQRAYEFYSEADRQRLGYLTELYQSGKPFREAPSE